MSAAAELSNNHEGKAQGNRQERHRQEPPTTLYYGMPGEQREERNPSDRPPRDSDEPSPPIAKTSGDHRERPDK